MMDISVYGVEGYIHCLEYSKRGRRFI